MKDHLEVDLDPDEMTGDGIAQAIRRKIICGRCASSTLLVWDGVSDHPRGTAKVTLSIAKPGSGTENHYRVFLVRCDFFRMNPHNPHQITHCEGFKDKKIRKKRRR